MSVRKTYTDECKREAIRLATERGNVAKTARDLGIADNLLHRCVHRYVNPKKRLESTPTKETAFAGQGNPRDAEMARLKRELSRAQEENALLKKAVASQVVWDFVSSRKSPREIPVYPKSGHCIFCVRAVSRDAGFEKRLSRLANAQRIGTKRGQWADHRYDSHGLCPKRSESFFSTLKRELVKRRVFATRTEARGAVFSWIEIWYNRKRRHSSLGYLSPWQFEEKARQQEEEEAKRLA